MGKPRWYLAGGVVALLTVLGLAVGPSIAFSDENEGDSAKVDAPDLGATNLDLFAALDARGQCLLRSSVFPAGGVGFKDSSLPYDDLSPLERAYATVRAELIRTTMDEMAGVTEVRGESGELDGVVFHVVAGATSYADGIDALVDRGRPELLAAYAELRGAGINVEVQQTAVVSLTDSCALQDAVQAALEGPVKDAGFGTVTDAVTGRLNVTVQPGLAEPAASLLSQFGESVTLSTFPEEVGRAGRGDS